MRVPCVGAVIFDARGRLLVIRRGRPPSESLWSIPGGRVEAGESLTDAVRREVMEETGLDVTVGSRVGAVDLTGIGDDVYAVTDFACALLDPSAPARAGDDAVDVRWVTRPELAALATSPGLLETLDGWAVWDSAGHHR